MRLWVFFLDSHLHQSYRWWDASHGKSYMSEDLGKMNTKVGGDKMALMNLFFSLRGGSC